MYCAATAASCVPCDRMDSHYGKASIDNSTVELDYEIWIICFSNSLSGILGCGFDQILLLGRPGEDEASGEGGEDSDLDSLAEGFSLT